MFKAENLKKVNMVLVSNSRLISNSVLKFNSGLFSYQVDTVPITYSVDTVLKTDSESTPYSPTIDGL